MVVLEGLSYLIAMAMVGNLGRASLEQSDLLLVATPLNCEGMYRGLIRENGVPKTAIFDDEVLE